LRVDLGWTLTYINEQELDEAYSIAEVEVMPMNVKFSDFSMPGSEAGPRQAEAMLNVQKEVLGAYEEANRAWLTRVQSEVTLWSGLAAKLTATRSVPEAVAAYQECVTQRMKMAAEDGQRLAEECLKGMNRISQVMSNR
jgi:hypothetical protein